MAVPGDCRNTVCISKSTGAVMGKQIHSKPYESLCESAQGGHFRFGGGDDVKSLPRFLFNKT